MAHKFHSFPLPNSCTMEVRTKRMSQSVEVCATTGLIKKWNIGGCEIFLKNRHEFRLGGHDCMKHEIAIGKVAGGYMLPQVGSQTFTERDNCPLVILGNGC